MSSLTSRIAALLIVGVTAAGCELFTQTDRSQIPSGFGGTNNGGSGGASTGGTGGTGGTSTSECSQPSDCPGMDTDCQQRTCTEGVCGVVFTPEGTPTQTQTPSDCQVIVCDGNGAEIAQNDDLDVLDDANGCTDDVCNAGTPANVASMAGSTCTDAGGKMCDGDGACVECLAPKDCSSGICDQNKCLPASCIDGVQNVSETDVDCGGASCAPCADGLMCVLAADC